MECYLTATYSVVVFQYLTTEYCTLCEALEPLLGIRDKEEIATTLIHIMQKLNRATNFLSDIVMAEIGRLGKRNAYLLLPWLMRDKEILDIGAIIVCIGAGCCYGYKWILPFIKDISVVR